MSRAPLLTAEDVATTLACSVDAARDVMREIGAVKVGVGRRMLRLRPERLEANRARREDVGPSFVALRGTKTLGSRRVVPVLPTTAPLLALALEHGGDGLLFEPWTNVRRDLHEACARVGIAPCSPNDLRRTFATWLRAAGVEPSVIAPAMGHADARMVERIYGRMSPEVLRQALLERVGGVVPLLPVGKAKGKRRTG